MYLFFDTETNGLPERGAHIGDPGKWPNIIQIAWILVNEDRDIISEHKFFIRPNGWTVPEKDFWIKHGYSTQQCEDRGYDIQKVMGLFIEDVRRASHLIAHNIDFDLPLIMVEINRKNFFNSEGLFNKDLWCTMKIGTPICKIPGKYGDYKWPTLAELHGHLFDQDFEGAHDALNDIKACMKCFFKMIDEKLLTNEEGECHQKE